jgi:hypothetical protein
LVATLAGTLLLGAWLFTDHSFWYRNLNLLQVNPLFLPLCLAFILFLFRGTYPRWAPQVAVLLGTIASVGLLMHILPVAGQANGEILALTLPLNGALALGSVRLHSGRPASHRTPPSHEKEPRRGSGKG